MPRVPYRRHVDRSPSSEVEYSSRSPSSDPVSPRTRRRELSPQSKRKERKRERSRSRNRSSSHSRTPSPPRRGRQSALREHSSSRSRSPPRHYHRHRSSRAVILHEQITSWLDYLLKWVQESRTDSNLRKEFERAYPDFVFCIQHNRLVPKVVSDLIDVESSRYGQAEDCSICEDRDIREFWGSIEVRSYDVTKAVIEDIRREISSAEQDVQTELDQQCELYLIRNMETELKNYAKVRKQHLKEPANRAKLYEETRKWIEILVNTWPMVQYLRKHVTEVIVLEQESEHKPDARDRNIVNTYYRYKKALGMLLHIKLQRDGAKSQYISCFKHGGELGDLFTTRAPQRYQSCGICTRQRADRGAINKLGSNRVSDRFEQMTEFTTKITKRESKAAKKAMEENRKQNERGRKQHSPERRRRRRPSESDRRRRYSSDEEEEEEKDNKDKDSDYSDQSDSNSQSDD